MTSEAKARWKDFVTSLVLIALGSGVLVEALGMPRYERFNANPYTLPGIVPGVLGIVLAVFGLLMLVRTVVAHHRNHAVPAAAGAAEPGSATRIVLTLALTLGYGGGLIGRMPFALATFLFVLAFLLVFQWTPALLERASRGALVRTVGTALLQALLVAATVTYVFERIFLVRLP
jgi:hypothetical protein